LPSDCCGKEGQAAAGGATGVGGAVLEGDLLFRPSSSDPLLEIANAAVLHDLATRRDYQSLPTFNSSSYIVLAH